MSFLKPEPPAVPEFQQPPTEGDPEVQRRKAEELRKLRLAKGRSSTILTGGMGVLGGNSQRKTLLGG